MPKAFAWILAAVTVLVLALFGLAIGVALTRQDPPSGSLDTDLEGVTVSVETTTQPEPEPPPEPVGDRECWRTFGADPRRSLARPEATLGLPARKFTWARGLGSYIEFPPVYCEGELYVNGFSGTTFAIDGPRVLVASQDGTVTALSRRSGQKLWQVRTAGKVESSPVVVDGLAYFGSHDGRLFAVRSDTGRVRWAYQTGGRINASPAVFGGKVCVTTYAGSFVCLDRETGE